MTIGEFINLLSKYDKSYTINFIGGGEYGDETFSKAELEVDDEEKCIKIYDPRTHMGFKDWSKNESNIFKKYLK